jgi:ribosome-binding factor A
MTERKNGRPEKVASRIHEEVSDLLLRGDIHDPDARGVMVSSVRVTPDLSIAHIAVRVLEAAPTEATQKRAVAAMRRATGFIRKTIAGGLQLRAMPMLQFHWDSGLDHAVRIETLLDEVRRERPEGEKP